MLSQLSIDMMIKDEEENNVDYDSYNPNFRYYCKNLVKVSNRNRIIKEQLRIDQSLRQSISAENFESIIERKIITERKRRRMTPGPSLLNPAERRVFLDINSCFMWYILKSKGCRNIIPDYELTYCREVLKNTIKKIPKGETYFGLGKLYFHDESYQESLYHFTEALKYSNDLLFKSWYSFLILKCGSSNREQASLVLSRLKEFLKPEPSLEIYWSLLTLSLKSLLRVQREIEMPQYYATKIKQLDTYYGYLAYAEIFLSERNVEKASNVYLELISNNLSRPEAYAALWNLWYKVEKKYDQAEDLMTQGFLRITDSEYDGYIILFCLNLAKAYAANEKFNYAFELLQEKYVEHPEYPVFLYQYGRICVKAENSSVIGSAIGALTECLRLCDSKRYPKIYYWLAQAYLKNNQFFEAYQTINIALELLGNSNEGKKSELTDALKYIKAGVSNAEVIYNAWKSQTDLRRCLVDCELALDYDCIREIKAKILWKLGEKDQAVKFLYWCIDDKPENLTCYFLLAFYLKKLKNYQDLLEVCKKMIKVSKNTEITTQDWMKSNIWFARAKSLLKKPDKAIPLLQCLAKVFPPLPYYEIPYTKLLIKAKTSEDILSAGQVSSKHPIYDFFDIKSSSTDVLNTSSSFESQDPMAVKLRRDFTKNFIEPSVDDISVSNTLSNVYLNNQSYKNIDLTISRLSDRGFASFASGIPTGKKVFIGFSVCSDISFLYYIGKVAMDNETSVQDGLCAISDYISLIRYEKDNKLKDIMKFKALFIKSILLILNDSSELGLNLLREIAPDLERLKLKKKKISSNKYLNFF